MQRCECRVFKTGTNLKSMQIKLVPELARQVGVRVRWLCPFIISAAGGEAGERFTLEKKTKQKAFKS